MYVANLYGIQKFGFINGVDNVNWPPTQHHSFFRNYPFINLYGAYYCYCAYILCISRYSDFLLVMLINAGIFLRGLKLCRESRS